MDYAFVFAINYIPQLIIILMLGKAGKYLSIPQGAVLRRGIGLFHVHGHVKECFPRYAPTFIPGAGTIDGEIVETLWSTLNHTASSARSMSLHHRQEYLDAHMGDSNWKKLVRMSRFPRFSITQPSLKVRTYGACASKKVDGSD